jgi:alpha-ketoglutarate-dependent taurine dioxygenase
VEQGEDRNAGEPPAVALVEVAADEELVTGDPRVRPGLLAPGQSLPLVIETEEGIDLLTWAAGKRHVIDRLLDRHGGILWRGFRLAGVPQFEQLIAGLSDRLLDYTYRSTPRSEVGGKIYTSTEYPPALAIPHHNEMSYTRSWPQKIWFLAVQTAAAGGETPIASSHGVFAEIEPEIRREFDAKGVMYLRNYGSGLDLPWQAVFQTSDRAAVEGYCRRADIGFEWRGEDQLRTWQTCQATAVHPRTGEMLWFNQAHLFHVSSLQPELRELLMEEYGGAEEELPRNACFGDRSPIDVAYLDGIRAAYARHEVVFPWRPGDLLMLDNMAVAHARRPYQGSRKVVVGMADAWPVAAARTDP